MRNFDSAEGTSGDGVVSTDLKIRDLIEFAYRFSEIFLPPLSVVSFLFFFFFWHEILFVKGDEVSWAENCNIFSVLSILKYKPGKTDDKFITS